MNKNTKYYINGFMRRFLKEQSEDEVLKMELKTEIEAALQTLEANPSQDNIIQIIDGVLEKVSLSHPEYTTQAIKLIYRDMALGNEIDGLNVVDDEEEDTDTDELTEIKKYLSQEDYLKLKMKLAETKIRIKTKLKENDTGTSDLPDEVKNEIKKIITDIIDAEKPEYINDVYGAITQKLMDNEILDKTNKSVIAAYVDELIKELGYDGDKESVGKTSIKTGEVETKSPYDTVTSQKEITDSIKRHGKMLHEIYKHSASRFLE
jgi:transcriptional regulator CtsR